MNEVLWEKLLFPISLTHPGPTHCLLPPQVMADARSFIAYPEISSEKVLFLTTIFFNLMMYMIIFTGTQEPNHPLFSPKLSGSILLHFDALVLHDKYLD